MTTSRLKIPAKSKSKGSKIKVRGRDRAKGKDSKVKDKDKVKNRGKEGLQLGSVKRSSSVMLLTQ